MKESRRGEVGAVAERGMDTEAAPKVRIGEKMRLFVITESTKSRSKEGYEEKGRDMEVGVCLSGVAVSRVPLSFRHVNLRVPQGSAGVRLNLYPSWRYMYSMNPLILLVSHVKTAMSRTHASLLQPRLL